MPTRTLACTDATNAARLLIHAACGADGEAWSLEALLRRLRARFLDGAARERARLALEIRDLKGRRVLKLDDAARLVELRLPAGTYHVTATQGGLRRSYTVALEQGASFDLHLRLPYSRIDSP